jgi:hypothetical protein
MANAENLAPHELEFTADVAAWINLIVEKDPSLPFAAAKCERRSQGSQQRRDLSLLDPAGRVLVTGEVKLPYRKDGATPYHTHVVRDARLKAERAGADYFFTWNVNECALWETRSANDDPAAGQNYRAWKVAAVAKETHLAAPATQDAIKRWLGQFLNDLAKIIRGRATVGYKAPDERFIDALEAALNLPIRLTLDELAQRYTTTQGKAELNAWMLEQGWTLSDDPQEDLERAAKFACYALVNKLVFYEALMKRYGAQLKKLSAPEHIDDGDALRLHLEGFFAEARRVTGDYETVFGEHHRGIGNRIPFYADAAVAYWRGLIEQIHEFDFSRLDYEIIGSIFERLIGPEERHKYGQFYTRAEVVDLINSFCIQDGDEAVLDPACGGGTFLVRAYARKRELQPARPHERLLEELYGVDVSPFACHLSTINLATRDLIQDENYPRIARADFFDLQPQGKFINLPSVVKTKGLGKSQQRRVSIPPLAAVIGNPPYVRQEDIRSDKQKGPGYPHSGTKEFYRALVEKQAGVKLSGRSDLHCYFWPHAASFLKPDGWLCLLTSSQWLDVEYGFRLQAWILARFKIVAVFESLDEPWFVGARVATTATLLRRCEDAAERAAHLVRFAQLRRPVAELLAHDGTTAGAIRAADDFRDEILNLTANTLNERYRARLVRQGELLNDGIRLGRLMRGQVADEDGDADTAEEPSALAGDYYGGKWGIHLRAPDLWFDLLDRHGDRFAPLGELADIRFGVKSGKDEFFYPRDVSADCLAQLTEPEAFRLAFGVDRAEIESEAVKLVKCGEKYGEIRPIEARFLEPEVHSLMEVKGYTVGPEACGRCILLVSEARAALADTHVLRYIEWGESKGWNKGATCAARASDEREWYDLTGHVRGALFWPKSQQYKHAAPFNKDGLQANCNLYDITPGDGIAPMVLAGILNSSWAVLAKFQYGRPVGNEGNLKTEVVDVSMMPLPDPRSASAAVLNKIATAFEAMSQRDALQFLSERRMRRMAYGKSGKDSQLALLPDQSELEMPDRRALDEAVLELLGVTDRKERAALMDRLYGYLREFFEQTRAKEEKAIANKHRAKRRAAASPAELAAQVLAELKDKHPSLLRGYADFLDLDQPFSTFDLPDGGEPELHHDMFASTGSVRFMRGKKQVGLVSTQSPEQAALLNVVARQGVRGLVRVPLDGAGCARLQARFEAFLENREQRIRLLIAERTGDADLQAAVLGIVMGGLIL